MSPNWSAQEEAVPYAELNNPQTLNLYAYGQSNPVSNLDEDGHESSICVDVGLTGCSGLAYVPDGTYLGQDGAAVGQVTYIFGGATDSDAGAQGRPPTSSSQGSGFWSHVRNLFHGHSWNYGTRERVTSTILPGEPDWYTTAFADVAGLIAAGTDNQLLGAGSAIASVANDHGPVNVTMTAASFLPEAGVPASLLTANADILSFEAQTAGEGMIEAIPAQTMDNGYGRLVSNPGEVDQADPSTWGGGGPQ